MSDEEADCLPQLSDPETQFIPQEDDDETLWEVIEITAQKGKQYKVRWKGNDPATQKPWPQSWVPKHDCTDDLVLDWKLKQAMKKKNRKGTYYHLSTMSFMQTYTTGSKRESGISKKPRTSTKSSTSALTSKRTASPSKLDSVGSTRRSTSTAVNARRGRSKVTLPSPSVYTTGTRSRGPVKIYSPSPLSRDHPPSRSSIDVSPTRSIKSLTPNTATAIHKVGTKRKHGETTSATTSARIPASSTLPTEEGDARTNHISGSIPPPRKRRKLQVGPVTNHKRSMQTNSIAEVDDERRIRKSRSRVILSDDDMEVKTGLDTIATPQSRDLTSPETEAEEEEAEERMIEESLSDIYCTTPPSSPLQPSPSQENESTPTPPVRAQGPAHGPEDAVEDIPTVSRPQRGIKRRAKERLEEFDKFPRPPILSPGAEKRLRRFDKFVMRIESGNEGLVRTFEEKKRKGKEKEQITEDKVQGASTSTSKPVSKTVSKPQSEVGMNTAQSKPPSSTTIRQSAKPRSNSFVDDIIPETEESQSQSQEMQVDSQTLASSHIPDPPTTPPPVNIISTLKSRMKPKTPQPKLKPLSRTSSAVGALALGIRFDMDIGIGSDIVEEQMDGDNGADKTVKKTSNKKANETGATTKPFGPIRKISPSVFKAHLPPSSLPESITESTEGDGDDSIKRAKSQSEEDDSIEQFESPVKGIGSGERRVGVLKLATRQEKDKQRAKESASDFDLNQRGQELAEAARKREKERLRAEETSALPASTSTKPTPRAENALSPPDVILPPEDTNSIVQQMENAYVDLSGGIHEDQVAASTAKAVAGANTSIIASESEGPS